MTKEELSRKIWITKKSRHHAEARLRQYSLFFTILLPYYGAAFLCFQLTPLYLKTAENPALSWMSTTCSIFVSAFSIIISGMDFNTKANKMKECYLKLGDVEADLESGQAIAVVLRSYNNVLKDHENHSYVDYWKEFVFKKVAPDENNPTVVLRHAKYFTIQTISFLFFILALIFPAWVFCRYLLTQLLAA